MSGQALRGWRVERGLTQQAAGALIGVSGAAWSSWEVGSKAPGVANAILLSDLTEGLVSIRSWAHPKHAGASPAQ